MSPLSILCNPLLSDIARRSSLIEGADLLATLARRADGEKSSRVGYKPGFLPNAIGLVLYLGVAVALSWRCKQYRAKYMIAMIVGTFAYALGISLRFGLRGETQSLTVYIAQFSLLALSPCAMIGSIYALLSRLAINLDAQKYLFIRARFITIIFICSDIFTFLMQSTGGAMMSGDDPDRSKLGQNLFLIGLIAQAVSFLLFSLLSGIFLRRAAADSFLWTRDAGSSKFGDWRSLAGVLVLTCVCILIRSLYRIIEANSLGKSHSDDWLKGEAAFYLLDALPIWLSLASFALFWPGRILQPHTPERLPKNYHALGGAGRPARLGAAAESQATLMYEASQADLAMGKGAYR